MLCDSLLYSLTHASFSFAQRSRRRSTQAAFRQKIRLAKEKEIAKQNESTVSRILEVAEPSVQVAPPQQAAPITGESAESEQSKPQQPVSQAETALQVQPSQAQQTQPDSQMQQPQSHPQANVQQEQKEPVQVERPKPIAPNSTSLQNSTTLVSTEISTISLTPAATGTATECNPKLDLPTTQADPNTRLEARSALWGMTLKPLTEDTDNQSDQHIREIEASVEACRDGVLDMYSYHRGREGMEPRDPDSGELLAPSIPTDTNHNFDTQKLAATVIVEFPLEDDDLGTTNTPEDSNVAMFRESLQWDLDDPTTPSPATFANGIAEEYGLSFGQMMDLASSIQSQIDAHLRQSCIYCAPIPIHDPNGNERRFNAVIRQAQSYDYLLRGDGGGVLISRKRTQKHQQQSPPKPLAQSALAVAATDSTSKTSRGRSGPEKVHTRQVIEIDEEVEDVYCEEIQKRVMTASKQSISATPVDGKSGLLKQKKDFQCHICHKKCDLTYLFACGIVNHVYCVAHCKVSDHFQSACFPSHQLTVWTGLESSWFGY